MTYDVGDTRVAASMLLLLLMMMMMSGVVSSDVLFQSLLLGSAILEPDLDDAHIQPGLGAKSFAHLSGGLAAVVVGAFQRIQLLAADRRSWSLAACAAVDPAAVVSVRDAAIFYIHVSPDRCRSLLVPIAQTVLHFISFLC